MLVRYIRGEKVLLDSDLAKLYGVSTGRLNEAVKRNIKRFPPDFMFQLSKEEMEASISQIAIANKQGNRRGGRRNLPYAFTEQGVAMLSSVLNSERAIAVNIEIMRAFVRLRQVLAAHQDLAERLSALEEEFKKDQKSNREQFQLILEAIEQLIAQPEPKKNPMGFRLRL